MSRRVRFGSTTDGTLDALDGQIDTGNENGNNPDNDLVIRDSTGTIVARYNESATTWQLEQPLDLQSNNVTNVGALDTERASIGEIVGSIQNDNEDTDLPNEAFTEVKWDRSTVEDDEIVSVEPTNDQITIKEGGRYLVVVSVRVAEKNDFSTGDLVMIRLRDDGASVDPEEQRGSIRKIGSDWQVVDTTTLIDVDDESDITAEVWHDAGQEEQTLGAGDHNYMTVVRLG